MTIAALEARLSRYALRCSPKAAGYVREELQAVRAARLEIERLQAENAAILRRAVETAIHAGRLEQVVAEKKGN